MNTLCTLTAILSSVSCGEVVIEGGKPYIIGNGILDEIKPIVRLLSPIGFAIIIPDPTPIKRAKFCYKAGSSFRKGEKAEYTGEFEMVNDTLVYTDTNITNRITVAYYFEVELNNGTNYVTRHYSNCFELYKPHPLWTPKDFFLIDFGSNATFDWKKTNSNVLYTNM